MTEKTYWIVTRFGIPLGLALGVLILRWGKENVAYILTVPVLFLFFRMYLSSQEQPDAAWLEGYKPYKAAIRQCNAHDVMALVLLMIFEGATAGFAEGRQIGAVFKLLVLCFLPYTFLTHRARIWLLRARAIADEASAILDKQSRANDHGSP